MRKINDRTKENNFKNGHVYLFKDIQHKQRNELGIASGQSVLISIFEPDPFYFTEDIQLIHYKDIVKTESVSSKENEFFEYVKQNSPVAYKRKSRIVIVSLSILIMLHNLNLSIL